MSKATADAFGSFTNMLGGYVVTVEPYRGSKYVEFVNVTKLYHTKGLSRNNPRWDQVTGYVEIGLTDGRVCKGPVWTEVQTKWRQLPGPRVIVGLKFGPWDDSAGSGLVRCLPHSRKPAARRAIRKYTTIALNAAYLRARLTAGATMRDSDLRDALDLFGDDASVVKAGQGEIYLFDLMQTAIYRDDAGDVSRVDYDQFAALAESIWEDG